MFSIDDTTDIEVEDLFQEICLMKKIGSHPRIVKFLGCVVISRPICLVLEFIPFGDLLSILRKLRGELVSIYVIDIFIFIYILTL